MGRLFVTELQLHIFCLLMVVSVCSSNAHVTNCLPSDREALMDFKAGLHDPNNVLSSWRGNNCCQWHGIHCDNNTGAVVAVDLHDPYVLDPIRYEFLILGGWEIRPSLMKLKSLRHLDLSGNFHGIPIPHFFGSLENLEYLNLSYASFGGIIPPNLGNLSRLEVLDLGSAALYVDNFQWITGLISIKYLSMRGVNLSLAKDWLGALNQLPSIVELHLSRCDLLGYIPSPVSINFTSLAIIDLSYNRFNSKIPDWLVNISSLQHIDMSFCSLNGTIPFGLGELPNLLRLNLFANINLTASCSQLLRKRWEKIQFLDLGNNKIHGKLPPSSGNMTSLIHLDLTYNAIEGGIPRSIGKHCNLICLSPLPNLQVLYLTGNQMVGSIPYWLGQLENLVYLDLSYNLFEGPIPPSLASLQNLAYLALANNKFNGTLPESLGQLSNLATLDVSFNQFTGIVFEACFSKLTKLTTLYLSFNPFLVNFSSNWMPPFQVKYLEMDSCNLGSSFPAWLKSQKEIKRLTFSNANISDYVPDWFWNGMSRIVFLSLSHNHLSGQIPKCIGGMWNNLAYIDLSSNNFTGRIPSNLANCSQLSVLDLSSNQLFGPIPYSLGQLQLQALHLSDNHLSGNLPSSFVNLSSLATMDLGNNDLSGEIPAWIGDGLSNLVNMNLRSNAFSGKIPSKLSNISSLQVLDLGENNLSGNIPSSLGDLKAMAQQEKWLGYVTYGHDFLASYSGQYYEDRLVVNTKGQSLLYTNTLPLVTSIDLSGNNLSGRFPKEITKLFGLVNLNLSGNRISGSIPGSISNMHQLSSLDLSNNQLDGTIPRSMSSLSFLGYLNLSHNNLSGAIPYTGHMTTFEASSFAGNPDLYGCPLPVRCLHNGNDLGYGANKGESNDETHDDEDGLIDKWFYLSIGVGFAAGLLVPFFILAMKRSWSDAYFDFGEAVIVRFLVWMHKRRINHGRRIKPRLTQ